MRGKTLADIKAQFGGEGPMVMAAALLHVEGLVKSGLCRPPPGPDGMLSAKARELLSCARELGWRPNPILFAKRISYIATKGFSEVYERRGS